MEKLIACCGLNCTTCDARIATMKDDNELRTQIAEKWKVQYNSPEICAEMINCTGCLEPGVKLGHCSLCEVKKCIGAKGFQTCAECELLEKCDTVGKILKFVPEALENLKSLN
jgi:hypothetical protein